MQNAAPTSMVGLIADYARSLNDFNNLAETVTEEEREVVEAALAGMLADIANRDITDEEGVVDQEVVDAVNDILGSAPADLAAAEAEESTAPSD